MKALIFAISLTAFSWVCFAEQPACKIVAVNSGKVQLTFEGKKCDIHGDALAPDDLLYRVELSPATVIQNVFIWEVTEFTDLENEFGKFYSLKGHRIEFSPKDTVVELLQGSEFGFWGSKSNKGGKVVFRIKKIQGFAPFAAPQEIAFENIGGPSVK